MFARRTSTDIVVRRQRRMARIAAGFVCLCIAVTAQRVHAAETSPVVKNVRLVVGASATITLRVPNSGVSEWQQRGMERVTLQPESAASVLRHPFWPSAGVAARLEELSVVPGGMGTFRMAVRAPDHPGVVEEYFTAGTPPSAAARVLLRVAVVPKPPPWQAALSTRALSTISMLRGNELTYELDVQNTGANAWQRRGKTAVTFRVAEPETRGSSFRHRFWKNARQPAALRQEKVLPNEHTTLRFALKAPAAAGTYTETFQLMAGLQPVRNGRLQLTIAVTDPAPPAPEPVPATQQAGEPLLDVGLRSTTEPLLVTSDAAMTITAGETVVGTVDAAATVTLTYADDGTYSIASPTVSAQGTVPYRITAADGHALTLTNFEQRPSWNTALNDNAFRGSVELRHAPATNTTWVINLLPLEQYLRGLAEAGNDAPPEYLKALVTAARGYAHYHVRTKTKHKADGFTIDATNDQVYRGYNFELRAPNITAAVQATAGTEVTHANEPVLTPYFAHTDGRTRAWEEVWSGGPYPWLVSVPDSASEGLTLYGHGVGMSGLGALTMAEEGKTFDQILAYYYTGTGLAMQY